MNPAIILAAMGALLTVLVVVSVAVLLRQLQQRRRLSRRIQDLGGSAEIIRSTDHASPIIATVTAIGNFVARRGLLSAKTRGEMEEALASLGLRGRNALGLFVGSKISLLVLGPALTILAAEWIGLSSPFDRLAPAVAGVFGLLLPDTIVRRLRQRYLDRVERGVPDALDMLVLCAQAGLGLEPGLNRVAREIAHAHPEMSRELVQTVDELRVSVDGRSALINLGKRTQLDSLKRVTSTLVQTLQYGTPLTESLRNLGSEMRQLMLTRYEERAARLPVLLTLPMILFIFPCVFIVIGGPAVLHLMQAFGH